MEAVFISSLKTFLDAVAEQMDLYVPKKAGQHYTFSKYADSPADSLDFNNVRTCTTAKDFLFPVCELASVYPQPAEPDQVKPFALFGLKDCDLRSIEILDKVFLEADFLDPFYQSRRDNMFIISSDCFEPAESCCCTLFGGRPYAEKGFDLNLSKTDAGFIVDIGSDKGKEFVQKHKGIFSDVPAEAFAQRDSIRSETQRRLEENNAQYKFNGTLKQIVEGSQESELFDTEAENCVECQACTRICPTCHCFYLYDAKQSDYFTKMKMWDSCMRMAYAAVAGGENPRKVLGDRIRHRLLHKFAYFLDRYGVDMCVGCGRCIDGCAGGSDTRTVLKKLSEQLKS